MPAPQRTPGLPAINPQRGPSQARPAQQRPPGAQAPAQGAPAPQRRPAQAQQRAPQQQRQAPRQEGPQPVDLHLRVGLEDELVRLSPEGWFKLLYLWILGGEDVIIRIPRREHEVGIVLRGSQTGVYQTRPFDPTKNLPMGDVVSAEEMRMQILKEKGVVREP